MRPLRAAGRSAARSATPAASARPTGPSSPSAAVTSASVPSAGDSISTVTLSVSISSSGSPFATASPSDFSHRSTLPVSCAIPSAGMITSAGMHSLVAGGVDDRVGDRRIVQVRSHLALPGKRTADGVLAAGRDEQLLRRETRDHLAAVFRDYELLLDPRRRPAVRRRPEGLEREHHPLLDLGRIVERHETAEDRLLPDREPDPVSVLQRERRLLVRETELVRLRPHGNDVCSGHAGPNERDGVIEDVATTLVSVHERARGAADGKRPVVARAVTVVRMEDVEVRRIAGPQHAVGEHMWMRAATLARDRVDALHMLRAQLVEHLVDERDAVVLAEAGPK